MGVVVGISWNRGRRPRERRDPKPRGVVDFTGGPVADLALRSTPDSKERTPDWRWPSINLSIHPTIKNVRTTVATLNPVASAKPGTKNNARSATIRRKKGVSGIGYRVCLTLDTFRSYTAKQTIPSSSSVWDARHVGVQQLGRT